MRVKLALPAALAIATLVGPAISADLPDYVPVEPIIEQSGPSGWYLRGDIGYALETRSNGYYYGWDPARPSDLPRFHYEKVMLRSSLEFSAGVGYQFNDHFRADVTLGHWSRSVVGRARSPYNCLGIDPRDVSCRFEDSSRVSAWELMANGYADLTKHGRFTPYLGAGVGLAHLRFGKLTNNATCVDGAGADVPGCGYVGTHGGQSSTRFAWALMAGTAIDITERIKIDIGYRFARVEGGRMWGWDAADTAAGAKGPQSFDNGFNTHSLRAGLRVALW